MTYSPYFNQSLEWSEFWQKANNDSKHKIQVFESKNLKAYVYQYPFILDKYFWYLPRGVILKNHSSLDDDLKQELENIILEISYKAKVNKHITFLKVDYDLNFLHLYIYNDRCRSPKILLDEYEEVAYIKSNKQLQYQSTKIIKLKELVFTENIQTFWNKNNKWFNEYFDKRTRYGTRKSLELNWTYSDDKNIENFEAFYELYQETSKRQNFNIHSKSYLKTLLFQPCSKLIVLKNKNKIHACWFGVIINQSIINLYGANSSTSRELYGQYLLHLFAIHNGIKENCLEYDLGGLEAGKGYDLFKQGYKGNIREFSETYDIIYLPIIYNLYHQYTKVKQLISGI